MMRNEKGYELQYLGQCPTCFDRGVYYYSNANSSSGRTIRCQCQPSWLINWAFSLTQWWRIGVWVNFNNWRIRHKDDFKCYEDSEKQTKKPERQYFPSMGEHGPIH